MALTACPVSPLDDSYYVGKSCTSAADCPSSLSCLPVDGSFACELGGPVSNGSSGGSKSRASSTGGTVSSTAGSSGPTTGGTTSGGSTANGTTSGAGNTSSGTTSGGSTSGTTSGGATSSSGSTSGGSTGANWSCALPGFLGFASQVSEYATGNGPFAIAAADFNGDGKLDLVTANIVDNTVSVLLGQDGGTFAPPLTLAVGPGPEAVVVADFNGDGKPDIAATNGMNNTWDVSVLLSESDGGFAAQVTYAVGLGGVALAVGDFNRDGKPDLVVANTVTGIKSDAGTVSVLINLGDGTFAAQVTYAVGPQPEALAVGDFNGDGLLDLAVASGYCTLGVLPGQAGGTFGAEITIAQFNTDDGCGGLVVADFNGDGKPDLGVEEGLSALSGGTASASVLLNLGDGGFAAPAYYQVGANPSGIIAADFAGRGLPDLAVTSVDDNDNGSVSILLNAGDGTFAAQTSYGVGSGACSGAAGDFTGHGRPDLAIPNSQDANVSALINLGGGLGVGTFAPQVTYTTGSQPQSVAVADFNGDGRSDVAVANFVGNSVNVFLNQAGGGFGVPLTYAVGSNPIAIAEGDFISDGKLDLVVANSDDGTVSVLLNRADGGFATQVVYSVGSGPTSVAVGDLNGDGRPDLAATGGANVSVLLNLGDGGFGAQVTYAAGSEAFSVAVGDFNGDGKLDLAVANSGADTASILLNQGGGTFPNQVTYAVGAAPTSVAVGDFNGDGQLDIAVANSTGNSVSVLLNLGAGAFANQVTYPVAGGPQCVAVGDFNGDGKPDLAVADFAQVSVNILFNQGSGTFAAPLTYSVGNGPWSVTPGDFSGNGQLDLAVVNSSDNTLGVLLNSCLP